MSCIDYCTPSSLASLQTLSKRYTSLQSTLSYMGYWSCAVQSSKSCFSPLKLCMTSLLSTSVNSWPLTLALAPSGLLALSTRCPTRQTFRLGRQVFQCHGLQTLEFSSSIVQWLLFFLFSSQIWFKDFSFSWTFLYLYDLVGFFPPFSMWSDLGTLWKALYNCNFKKLFIIINIIIIIDTPMWWYLLKDMHLLPSNLIIFL